MQMNRFIKHVGHFLLCTIFSILLVIYHISIPLDVRYSRSDRRVPFLRA